MPIKAIKEPGAGGIVPGVGNESPSQTVLLLGSKNLVLSVESFVAVCRKAMLITYTKRTITIVLLPFLAG